MANSASAQLRQVVLRQYARLCEEDPRAAKFPCPAVDPPFAPDEAEGFLGGLDAGLFALQPALKRKDGLPEIAIVSGLSEIKHHFFWMDGQDGKRKFAREGVTAWAAAADLILRLDWPRETVRVESDNVAFDLIAFDRSRAEPDARTILVGEAKARPSDLRRQVSEMVNCQGINPEVHKGWPRDSVAHHKCEGLLREGSHAGRTVYLWAVAPRERRGFVATLKARSFDLTEVGWPPSRPLL
jgi:hypothetical protein